MGSDLVAGTRILAADFPVGVGVVDDTNQENISTTTYTAGSPVVDRTFVAPTSGRILLIVGGGARDNAGTPSNRAFITPEVFEGVDASGTQVLPPDVTTRGVTSVNTSSTPGFWCRASLLEGLTPEATHYARVLYRVDGGTTVDVIARDIEVIPVP